MTELERAIVLLQEGRTKLEECAEHEADISYKEEMQDIADDITYAIGRLEECAPNRR
jgi:hypothetical protein